MASQPQPMPQGSTGAPPSAGQQPQGGGRDQMMEFVSLAQQVQQLAQRYPEFTEVATQILPLIQKGMSRVAGNAQRQPERQAPPIA